MNQVLEFLAENYIYVAGGSLGIIIILIIDILSSLLHYIPILLIFLFYCIIFL